MRLLLRLPLWLLLWRRLEGAVAAGQNARGRLAPIVVAQRLLGGGLGLCGHVLPVAVTHRLLRLLRWCRWHVLPVAVTHRLLRGNGLYRLRRHVFPVILILRCCNGLLRRLCWNILPVTVVNRLLLQFTTLLRRLHGYVFPVILRYWLLRRLHRLRWDVFPVIAVVNRLLHLLPRLCRLHSLKTFHRHVFPVIFHHCLLHLLHRLCRLHSLRRLHRHILPVITIINRLLHLLRRHVFPVITIINRLLRGAALGSKLGQPPFPQARVAQQRLLRHVPVWCCFGGRWRQRLRRHVLPVAVAKGLLRCCSWLHSRCCSSWLLRRLHGHVVPIILPVVLHHRLLRRLGRLGRLGRHVFPVAVTNRLSRWLLFRLHRPHLLHQCDGFLWWNRHILPITFHPLLHRLRRWHILPIITIINRLHCRLHRLHRLHPLRIRHTPHTLTNHSNRFGRLWQRRLRQNHLLLNGCRVVLPNRIIIPIKGILNVATGLTQYPLRFASIGCCFLNRSRHISPIAVTLFRSCTFFRRGRGRGREGTIAVRVKRVPTKQTRQSPITQQHS